MGNGTAWPVTVDPARPTFGQQALTSMAGTQANGEVLRSDGTNTGLAPLQSGDVPTQNPGPTYYVDQVAGNNTVNNGLSTSAPFATLAYAIAQVIAWQAAQTNAYGRCRI